MDTAEIGWEACYSTPLDVQAHLVKGFLEQYGVPCLLESGRFGMEPITFGALGEVRILVREDWAPIARGLLRGRQARRTHHLRVVKGRGR
jgi:hypothetical protein